MTNATIQFTRITDDMSISRIDLRDPVVVCVLMINISQFKTRITLLLLPYCPEYKTTPLFFRLKHFDSRFLRFFIPPSRKH